MTPYFADLEQVFLHCVVKDSSKHPILYIKVHMVRKWVESPFTMFYYCTNWIFSNISLILLYMRIHDLTLQNKYIWFPINQVVQLGYSLVTNRRGLE